MSIETSRAPVTFVLDPALRLGVPQIDDEHEQLLACLNSLIQDADAIPGGEAFMSILERLSEAIRSHFQNEEQFMKACGLPADEVRAHASAHTDILAQSADLVFDLMTGQAYERRDVLQLIKGWVLDHLLRHDLRIKLHLQSRSGGADRPLSAIP